MSMAAGDMFEVDEVEVRGVPLKVFKNAFPSIRAMWQLTAIHGPADYLVY